jgi:ESS family glutamate:Na+ symporter
MQIDINVFLTVVLAIVVLLIGRLAISHVAFLRKYSIPEPVVGGLIAALLITGLRFGLDAGVSFDMSLQTPLLLAFFSTVGLSADVRMLLQGGYKLVLLLIAVAAMLPLQNAIGVGAAMAMDLNPLVGMLSASITMAGGHGTGAAWATTFGEVNGLRGAMEVAMAAATFGLVLGGIIGGPVAQWLITRHGLRGEADTAEIGIPGELAAEERRPLSPESFAETLLIIMFSVGVGGLLAANVTLPGITLPTFVWCLFVGIVVRNGLGLSGLYRIDNDTLELLGTVCLSLFLAMALMALRLWELVSLALPILVILAAQTVFMALYAGLVTFRVMGSDYDAAVIAAGNCGFGLGATPTAIANMQAVTSRHGHSPLAFILVPVIGAFLIDIVNALVIQGFLALPMFGY